MEIYGRLLVDIGTQTFVLVKGASLPTQLAVVLFGITWISLVLRGIRSVIRLISSHLGWISWKSQEEYLENLGGYHEKPSATKSRGKKLQKKKPHRTAHESNRPVAQTADVHVTKPRDVGDDHDRGISLKTLNKLHSKQTSSKLSASSRRHESSLYLDTLQGHTDAVCGLSWASSFEEKQLVTACKDREIRLFCISSQGSKKSKSTCLAHHVIRTGLFDVSCVGTHTTKTGALHVALMTYGPHATVEVHLGAFDMSNTRHPSFDILDTKEKVFAPKINFEPLGLVRGHQGRLTRIIAASSKPRVAILTYDASTSHVSSMGSFDTSSIVNNDVTVSPDGSMFAVATFSPDVGLYSITGPDGKNGRSSVKKIASLVGHKKKVTSVSFSPCGSKMVTASEDYTLRIWNIAVRHELQEDPKCIISVGVPSQEAITRMAWTGNTIAAISRCDIFIFDSTTGSVKHSILHAHDAPIRCLEYAPEDNDTGTHVLATGGDDCCVKLWKY